MAGGLAIFELLHLHASHDVLVLLRLLVLLVVMAFTGHIIACGWYYLSISAADTSRVWTAVDGVQDEDWLTNYVAALYWGFATLTTTGFGDISAKTLTERGFSLAMMLVGAAAFATMVGKVSAVASKKSLVDELYQSRKEAVTEFIKFRRLPDSLKNRIFDYYSYVSRVRTFVDEQQIISELSPSLRRDIMLHLNRELIDNVPIFAGADPGFTTMTVTKLKLVLCLPGEEIVRQGEHSNAIYFIRSGDVEVIADEVAIRVLDRGAFFGEHAFLDRSRCTATCRAVTHVELYALKRDDVEDALLRFPDFEKTLRATFTMREQDTEKTRARRRQRLGGGGGASAVQSRSALLSGGGGTSSTSDLFANYARRGSRSAMKMHGAAEDDVAGPGAKGSRSRAQLGRKQSESDLFAEYTRSRSASLDSKDDQAATKTDGDDGDDATGSGDASVLAGRVTAIERRMGKLQEGVDAILRSLASK